MKHKKTTLLLITITLLTITTTTIILLNANYGEETTKECIDVNNVASFIYNTCYDATTQNIYMEITRKEDNYNLQTITIQYFDTEEKKYTITTTPTTNDKKEYQIKATKKPERLDITLNIIKNFQAPQCETPRKLFINYCPTRTTEELTTNINPLTGTKTETITIGEQTTTYSVSDIIAGELINKEAIWSQQCESVWRCNEWEECNNGIQKRTCKDLNNCQIPIFPPQTVKTCDGTCKEQWTCEWSSCEKGITTPTCKDLNNCGTTNHKPQELPCKEQTTNNCKPEITCEEWSECKVDYNIKDLTTKTTIKTTGTKTRICKDNNQCTTTNYETKECSLAVDIYTKEYEKCGILYRGIYDKLTNNQLARLQIGTTENPALNIDLTGTETEYCDHCSDGIQNGDEKGIDCGGSCKQCN